MFSDRTDAFAQDSVLQENVIFSAIKGEFPSFTEVSSSDGSADSFHHRRRLVPVSEVVRPNDPHKFIRIVDDEADAQIADVMHSLPCSLLDLGLSVSTGRVVDFRAREWLRSSESDETIPLIYPASIRQGAITWPVGNFRKPQHMKLDAKVMRQLFPNGRYVLTKRFTSKEEPRRLVAAILEADDFPNVDFLGFENHTNVYHVAGTGFDDYGLAQGFAPDLLNSTIVDSYFRQFSGHTQVNCGDLRVLRYPTMDELTKLGNAAGPGTFDQDKIDSMVSENITGLGSIGHAPIQ